jgi:hypothetical protein
VTRTYPRPPGRVYTPEEIEAIRQRSVAAHRPEQSSIPGEVRHAAETWKRTQLTRELRQLLDEPLHKPVLSEAERQAIRVREALRRRPVGKP